MGHFLSEYRNSILKIHIFDYNGRNEDEYDLKNIEMEPIRGRKNIIFLETRCTTNSNEINDTGLLLTKRQACSIESAAKMNPDASVHLLYSCSMNGGIMASLEYVKMLFKYPNIKIWKLDIPRFLAGTPLEDWDFQEQLESSNWPVEHSSDVLRYVSLFKYGGTYLDLDVVIRK
jgi:lactosylceramide 4-alpha-galactosyltransferase